MLTTDLLWNEDVFTELGAVWDELAASGMTNTPFQFLAYQQAWWRHLGPADLMTIRVRDEADKVIGIAPLYKLNGIIHFNGCIEETDYLDLISRSEDAQAVWAAVLDHLCTNENLEWNALDFCNIPAESPSRTILAQLAESRGLSLDSEIMEVCPVITLPESFEDYLGTLDKKQRHEVRRKLRRAKGAEATLRQVGPEDDIAVEVDRFLELLQKSTPEKRAWLNDGRRALFHDVAKAAHEAGNLELLYFVADDVHAAALFNFNYADRTWVYNSGLDPEAFGHLSAGVVLSSWSIEQAINDGNHHFDFLRGNETYKYRFGAEDTTIHRIHITR